MTVMSWRISDAGFWCLMPNGPEYSQAPAEDLYDPSSVDEHSVSFSFSQTAQGDLDDDDPAELCEEGASTENSDDDDEEAGEAIGEP